MYLSSVYVHRMKQRHVRRNILWLKLTFSCQRYFHVVEDCVLFVSRARFVRLLPNLVLAWLLHHASECFLSLLRGTCEAEKKGLRAAKVHYFCLVLEVEEHLFFIVWSSILSLSYVVLTHLRRI